MRRIGGSTGAGRGWHDNGALGLLSHWRLTAPRMISHFLMLARHRHRTASPPTRPPHRILPGSELNRRGLTNQTTHAKTNAEEPGREMGAWWWSSNALQGSDEDRGARCSGTLGEENQEQGVKRISERKTVKQRAH